MSDLAKSLTSALTLASNNILYIFRPLRCFEVISLGSYLAGWYPHGPEERHKGEQGLGGRSQAGAGLGPSLPL